MQRSAPRPAGAVEPHERRRAGVKSLYEWLAAELHATMLLSGVAKVTDLKRRNIGVAKA